MAKAASGNVNFAPVGDTLDNGFDIGGSRIYPWSTSLAIAPPAYYSDYIGPATGLPVSVPAASLPDTVGAGQSAGNGGAVAHAAAHPWGRTSPLPWVALGLVGAAVAMHQVHYKSKG
jgi:hypothetical protein